MVNPSSSETAEAAPVSDNAATVGVSSSIHERVIALAGQSGDRGEFLRLLAAELRESFQVALVAVDSSHWTGPMMLVADDLLSEVVNRAALRSLLQTAARMPIACDVPTDSSSSHLPEVARGIRVELTPAPDRSAILLIYPNRQRPAASDQIHDLKELNLYAQSTRDVIETLPAEVDALNETASTDNLLTLPASTLLGNRHSLRLFHRDLDLQSTNDRIANESRRLLGCDRVTMLVPSGRRYRVRSISGVAVVDSRSNSVRAVEELASCSAVMSRPLVFPGEEPLPPQIQEPLDHYLDETGVMSALMLPLHSPDEDGEGEGIEASEIDPFHGNGDILGVMVLEYFSGKAPPAVNTAIALVASEATLSLRNSLEHHQVFGLTLWKTVGSVVHSSRLNLLVASLFLATGLLIAGATIQVEHHVIATGHVEPTSRRQIYATVDGIVKKVLVSDGQKVEAGQPLFELENTELESRAESLSGEIQTASRRLASVQAVRLSSDSEPNQSSRLALEERQLESELTNLRMQQKIVREQQDELIVTSPIAGTVVGWQLERRLSDRPVSRGNLLVSVVDHAGPWSLRLDVPDRDAGPVLASAKQNTALPIQFAVATDPEASYEATLQEVGTAARMNDSGEHIIDATAQVAVDSSDAAESSTEQSFNRFDPFRGENVRVGADVTARIACGQRSVLRSWFSDVVDFTHRNILFYFR